MRWSERMPVRMRIPLPDFFSYPLRRIRTMGSATAAFAVMFVLAGAPVLSAQTPPTQRFVVVLDAAHGGDDTGARLGNQLEKTYTLALSVRLRSLLAARGIAVVTTRETDTTVDADQRAAIADRANAKACVSLHASDSGSGVHVFVSSLAPSEAGPILAWKTAQAAWITRSLSLAGVINSALTHADVAVTLGRIALPAIDSMTCPAVAVEIAPQASSDASGTAGLDNPDYQAHVTDALAAALVEWRSEDR
jgi:N-acetylmuramoyl-L-alanine amidase